jgi:hypothetical protein
VFFDALGDAMHEFSWRLVDANGATRLRETMRAEGISDLWTIVPKIVGEFGRPGEILQILDELGDIVIYVGVATAKKTRQLAA